MLHLDQEVLDGGRGGQLDPVQRVTGVLYAIIRPQSMSRKLLEITILLAGRVARANMPSKTLSIQLRIR